MIASGEKISVSVIMPALNEEKDISAAIDSVLGAFLSYKINGEIIVVDDGSSDKTAEIVRQKQSQGGCIRLISHRSPQGIGASFWDGVHSSRAEAVVMVPGDNENKPDEILRHLPRLGAVDMVVPYVVNISARGRLRSILSRLYTFILNHTFPPGFRYFNGTVVYRKTVLSGISIRSKGFFYQAEILIKVLRKGRLFAEVPYFIRQKDRGRRRALSWRSFLDVGRCYLNLIKDIYISPPLADCAK